MSKRKAVWTDKRRQQESMEGHENRLDRRRMIAELRAQAEIVERDGRRYRVVRLPDEHGRLS